MEELDLTFVDQTVERVGTGTEKVLEILQALQAHYGYLPAEALKRVCDLTEITPATITGVSTFYDQFRHRPAGKHIIHVCIGTACHVKGADQVYDEFRRYLRIPEGDDTDAQKLFTVEKIACLGCCTLAPAVQIDDVTYGHLTRETIPKVLNDFLKHASSRAGRRTKGRRKLKPGAVGELRVGLGSCCVARGSGRLNEAMEKALAETGIKVPVKRVGCVGMCHQTPLLEVVRSGGRVVSLCQGRARRRQGHRPEAFRARGPRRRIADNGLDRSRSPPDRRESATLSHGTRSTSATGRVCDFLGHQHHMATEYCGQIDPTDLDEYLRHGGFEGLKTCLEELAPEQIIDEIEASGPARPRRGRFPDGLKWAGRSSRRIRSKKYVVCNGDEGDPGAFMDRMLLESYPYRIIEGMAIAARCVGAQEGYLYIRAEYPLAVKRVTEAIDKCCRTTVPWRPHHGQ